MTNAASIWVAAAVGMGVGFQYYIMAAYTSFLLLLILNVGRLPNVFNKKQPEDQVPLATNTENLDEDEDE